MKRANYFPRSKPPCPMSDPANPHELCRRSDPPLTSCFSCKGQQHLENKRYYYYCDACDLECHRGCHLVPLVVKHPFHLIHPLILTFPDGCDNNISESSGYWCSESSDSDKEDEFNYDPEKDYGSDESHQKCKSCERNLDGRPYYHCSVCNFSLHLLCAVNKPPLNIENTKSHPHTLTFFPRLLSTPCDACGFSLNSSNSQAYTCLLCNYLVHRWCVYLPRVIKITRHSHRLSHTSSALPSGDRLPCGVCRKPVDINYGHYSCNKGCHYALHSKCATRKEVWDGKDLEDVPEEEEEQVIEPFVRIDEETIQHFSHEHHHLRFDAKENFNSHEGKFCQACTLQITVSDPSYSCMECDFVLHERCAGLPRQKNHPLHKHPLTLFHPFSPIPSKLGPEYYSEGLYICDGCRRCSFGFVYKCSEKDCDFQLDVRCASLPDPTRHELHDHPLFFNLTKGECMGCQSWYCGMYLECIECEVFLGLSCATLPSVAHYKHDKHPLTVCYREDEKANVQYWCEICETKVDANLRFYKCNFCQITLHVDCLLGKNIYMKPNHTLNIEGEEVDVIRNKGNVRPMCDHCGHRCIYHLVFKCLDKNYCCWSCTKYFYRHRRE